MTTLNKQIKLGALISYITLIINTLISLIYLPWMVSIIGKSDYALYTLVTTFVNIFMIDFGLSSAVSRFIAKYNSENKNNYINSFIGIIEKIYFFFSMIIFIILISMYFFLDNIYAGLSIYELEKYKKLYLIVTFYSVISFPFIPFNGILNAYEKFVQLKLCDLFQKLLTIFLTIIALLNNKGVSSIVIINAASGIITILIKGVIIHINTPIRFINTHIDKNIIIEIFRFSIWITVITLAQRCIFNLAPSILGITSNSDAIAIFAPANTLESFFYTFAAAVNGLFLPMISRFIANKEEEKINKLMVQVGRYQFIVLSYIFIVFLCIGKDFMLVWMGEEFVLVYPCALLMFIPDILLFTEQIANTTMIVKNEVKIQSMAYVIMAIVCIIMSFILCKSYGAIGSAFSIAISYFVLFVILNIIYIKRLHLNIFDFFKECYWKLGPIIFVISIITFIICNILKFNNTWINMIIKILLITFIYFIAIYSKLEKSEKNKLKEFHRKYIIKTPID